MMVLLDLAKIRQLAFLRAAAGPGAIIAIRAECVLPARRQILAARPGGRPGGPDEEICPVIAD
ncbi:MAG TPA: hypothetical protein VIX87_01880 [Steroidobacteraceae bacterium]